MPNVVGLTEADARRRAARRRTRGSRCASAPPTTRRRTARCSTSVRARAWRSTRARSVIVIVGRFEAPAEPTPARARRRRSRREGRRPGRRPLGRARGVAGVGRGRARRPRAGRPRAGGGGDLPRRRAGRLDGEAAGAGAGRRAARLRRRPSRCCTAPTARTAPCRGCSRRSTIPYVGRGGDGLGGVHGQGAVQGPDGGRRRAAGRLRRDPRGRGPGQPGRPGAARVREARAAGLVGGHLEGVDGGGAAARRWRPPSSTTRW